MVRVWVAIKKMGILACALGVATAAQATCVDGAAGAKVEKIEIFKSAVLAGDFELAALQVDTGGRRANEVVSGLNQIKLAGVEGFEKCILLSRRAHSPHYTSEIVYFSDGANVEYWLLVSAIHYNGEETLTDAILSNSYKRFRDWLQ